MPETLEATTASPAGAFPRRLAACRGLHAGERIVVCGCGASLAELPEPERFVTIGVNDVGRMFQPTYLVVLNPRRQFKGDRFRWVETSRARAVFTQLELGLAHPNVVRFKLGRRGGVDLSDPDSLPYTRNSPYVAVALAAYMGAERVGLIGVDFTDHHFFGKTGRHPLARRLAEIDREYAGLAAALGERGVELVNLSRQSRLTSLPRLEPEAFLAGEPAPPPRRRSRHEERDMQIAVERRPGASVVSAFLDGFAATAEKAGFRVLRGPAARDRPAVTVVWNGRRQRARGPLIYAEHGWLPRSWYQVSTVGINADSHAAPFQWDGRPLAEPEREAVHRHLDLLRRGDETALAYARTDAEPVAGLPDAFLLVPLQMEWDTNVRRHVPARFRGMQALVDAVTAADPPWPVIFKQHPSDARRKGDHLRLAVRRRQDELRPHHLGNIHQLLKTGRCRGIVSLNSNVVHDGLIWDVPSAVLGANVWPRRSPSPFYVGLPTDWEAFERHGRAPETAVCREAYVHHLLCHQWSPDDLGDVERVERLLERAAGEGRRAKKTVPLPRPEEKAKPAQPPPRVPRTPPPRAPRTRPSRVSRTRPSRVSRTRPRPARDGAVVVNVVARDRGWLFEDLKRHFRAARHPGVRVVAGETAQASADAWIFLRAKEAGKSPDPRRTVVQIHDLYDRGLYREGGERSCVARCAAVTLTHPGQRRLLETSGVDLGAKQVLLRPLGALEAFTLRPALPERFTVAWVGRPSKMYGQAPKRVEWFVEALRGLGGDVRAVLLGERLEEADRSLRRAGIEVVFHHRRRNPIATYPRHYHQLDAVAITAAFAAGPNCLFEALASGVPVVATPAGWVPELVRDGENGFRVDSAEQMTAVLERLRGARQEWFEKRSAIRGSLGGRTVESWVEDNLDMARRLARPETADDAAPAPAARRPARRRPALDDGSPPEVLLVGNGPSAARGALGPMIDRSPLVVRFNAYETAGFEAHVGTRLDVWALNQNRVTRDRLEAWARAGIPVPRILVVPRSGRAKHCRNVEVVAGLARRLYPRAVVEEIPGRIAAELERALGGSQPTAGLVTLAFYLERFPRVHVYGFDVLRRGECPGRHYWGGSSTIRRSHDPGREGEWLDRRIRDGIVVAL